MNEHSIKIGMNARLFPNDWHPLVEEIKFAKDNRFQSIQLSVRDRIIDHEFLGDGLNVIAKALDESKLDVAVELLIKVGTDGRTALGKTPLEILEENLSAINLLRCKYVHWHLVPLGLDVVVRETIHRLEKLLIPQFIDAVKLAQKHQFDFGFEHNEPDLLLFAHPEGCKLLMDAVPGLKFVWDINHTIPEHLPRFQELVADASIIHVSDTELPEVNYHLPLGKGNIDFEHMAKILLEKNFSGPAIFEIGGLMKSGGYGKDTDDALIESYLHFQKAIDRAQSCRQRSRQAV